MLKTLWWVLTVGWLSPAVVGAAVIGNFSGGSGTPITFTLPSAVSYTVTANTPEQAFTFKGAAPNNAFYLYNRPIPVATGTITYTVNGGAPRPVNHMSSGYLGKDIVPTDFYIFDIDSFSNLVPGDVVVLRPGYLTTNLNLDAAAPPSGTFTTFLTNGSGARVSADGVTVPEPTAGFLALLSLAAMARRPKRGGTT